MAKPVLRMTWSQEEHVVIESVVDDVVVATLIIEESGDAKNKVVHVTTEHDASAKVQVHL